MLAHLDEDSTMVVGSASAWVLGIVSAAILARAAIAQESAPAKPPVQAIWMAHEISFAFQSFRTFYSCDSLERKIKRILVAVGTSPDMRLNMRGCSGANGIARYPQVDITVVSAVEATPEALAKRDQTRSTRELAARVRGMTEELRELEAKFPAVWREVPLSRGRLYLEPGDCELIDQLKDKVFPQLGVRVVDEDIKCAPNQLSAAQPKIVVEALFALPKPDDVVQSP